LSSRGKYVLIGMTGKRQQRHACGVITPIRVRRGRSHSTLMNHKPRASFIAILCSINHCGPCGVSGFRCRDDMKLQNLPLPGGLWRLEARCRRR
jgi:hypothetical protein